MPIIELPLGREGPIIMVSIQVSAPRMRALELAAKPIPTPFVGRALIDTGASCTVIDHEVVRQLAPTGTVPIHTPSTGGNLHVCNQYDVSFWFVNVELPHQPPVPAHPIHFVWPVIDAELSAQKICALIGRDLLARCHFNYLGVSDRFSLSY